VTNYGALAATAANRDPRRVKESTDLATVAMACGVDLEPDGNGRLVGLCPLHDDTRPSFAVWEYEGAQWCGCFACAFGTGDLFDFLMAVHGCTFGDALRLAVALRDGDTLPDAPDVGSTRASSGPASDMASLLACASGDTHGLITRLLCERRIRVPVDWLMREFGVTASRREVLIPHFDIGGKLVALKHRAPRDGWQTRSVQGSHLDALYGIWRYRYSERDADVVVCEGESDTWSVARFTNYGRCVPDVVGLPSGVAAQPHQSWLEWLRGRRVTLLFDGDHAGRSGAQRWAEALTGVAASVRVGHLPDGQDCTEAGPVAVRLALVEVTGEDGLSS